MVTEVSKGRDTTVRCFRGLSTDSKPTDAGNGAEFREIDTGDIYYFNEAGSAWVKWTGGSGGGGGGSDFSTAEVTITYATEFNSLEVALINDNKSDYTQEIPSGASVTVILYKGVAYGYCNTGIISSVSGDIELDPDYPNNGVFIRGNGTITIAE